MKLKNRKSITKVAAAKSSKPAPKASTKSTKETAAPKGRVFSKDNSDLIPFMVAPRVPQRAVLSAFRNKPLPKKDPTHAGYLIATGPRGTYISEVLTDDGNFYARERRVGGFVYGQIDLLPKSKEVTVEIVDQDELLKRVRKMGRVMTFTRQSDKKDVTTALLSDMEGIIMSGVTREGKSLRVLTLHAAGKTQAPSDEQYGNPRAHKAARTFIAGLKS